MTATTTTPQTQLATATAKTPTKQDQIRTLLERAAPSMAAVLPKHLTIERLTKIALSACARNAGLLACSQLSLVKAVMQGAELGLEAGGLLGEAYLMPFKGEVVLIPGYRGLCKLARQSGMITSIEAHVVHERDTFTLCLGLDTKLEHVPLMTGADPGNMIAVYCVVRFKEGGHQFDVMTKSDVERIRERSPSKADGPWVTDFDEMAKKTVVRRCCKYLPLSPELARAMEHEAAVDEGIRSPVLDVEFFEEEKQHEKAAPPATPEAREFDFRVKLDTSDTAVKLGNAWNRVVQAERKGELSAEAVARLRLVEQARRTALTGKAPPAPGTQAPANGAEPTDAELDLAAGA